MTLCKFSFNDYYREIEPSNDNGARVATFDGLTLTGWEIRI